MDYTSVMDVVNPSLLYPFTTTTTTTTTTTATTTTTRDMSRDAPPKLIAIRAVLVKTFFKTKLNATRVAINFL